MNITYSLRQQDVCLSQRAGERKRKSIKLQVFHFNWLSSTNCILLAGMVSRRKLSCLKFNGGKKPGSNPAMQSSSFIMKLLWTPLLRLLICVWSWNDFTCPSVIILFEAFLLDLWLSSRTKERMKHNAPVQKSCGRCTHAESLRKVIDFQIETTVCQEKKDWEIKNLQSSFDCCLNSIIHYENSCAGKMSVACCLPLSLPDVTSECKMKATREVRSSFYRAGHVS